MSGMDLFLFNHDRFKALYNCSFKTDKEWSSYGVQNTFLSALFLLFGFVYITTYMPILIVMVRPKLFKNACFKIMFFLGIIDMLSTVANCLIPGYFGLIGAVGCSYINFLYVAGSYGLACWFGQCALCVTLGLNRLIDFIRPHWMPYLFDGPKTFFWIFLCFGYSMLGFFFCTTPIFSSLGMAYFFDPYFLISMEDVPFERSGYMSAFHSLNNIVIVAILPILHGLVLLAVYLKSREASTEGISTVQRKLFLQAFYICLLNFVSASIYVYMQFFPCPMFLITVAQIMWQGSNGGAVFIYLILNGTIRNGVFELLCSRFKRNRVINKSHTYVDQSAISPHHIH